MIARPLVDADIPALEALLAQHADSSMILRSNLRAAGLADTGARYSGLWAGLFDGAALIGAAAHFWNDMLILQCPAPPEGIALLARAAASGRPVAGVVGPLAQAQAGWAAIHAAPPRIEMREDLFSLDLRELQLPGSLQSSALTVRRATAADLPTLSPWSYDYNVEVGQMVPGPASVTSAAEKIAALVAEDVVFVACSEDGAPRAMSSFNARMPDCVQIGGVWTPPEGRRRHAARACVAGSLQIARAEGVARSILFTRVDNTAARLAYLGIGYRIVGDYGILLV